jgi:hypothetical protein
MPLAKLCADIPATLLALVDDTTKHLSINRLHRGISYKS